MFRNSIIAQKRHSKKNILKKILAVRSFKQRYSRVYLRHFTDIRKISNKSEIFNTYHRLKRGDRRVRIFSAHNNWWVTPEVSLPLPYQRSANVF